MSVRILEGDCLEVMPTLEAESVDAIVCDPPYHLTTEKRGGTGMASDNPDSPAGRARISTGFMRKAWDGGDIAFRPETWSAALQVAKPGAHLVAFGGTRTFHRLTVAIEDAGWEIRDCLSWLYGSGFPKSLDVSRAIDRAAGAERLRIVEPAGTSGSLSGPRINDIDAGEPITAAAKRWWGWGTALKPAWEPIILARKPLKGTVAASVQARGTGALNINGCRIGVTGGPASHGVPNRKNAVYGDGMGGLPAMPLGDGRWPANVVLDEEAAALVDDQSGESTSGSPRRDLCLGGIWARSADGIPAGPQHGDSGGASRFFYTAKASRSERESGLDTIPARVTNADTPPGTKGSNSPRAGANRSSAARNHHPTVKPLDLMQWLCRLVTPKGGLILDPFCGSGSTGRAAVAEGFSFIGIELHAEYAEIARARIADYAPLFNDPEVA